MLRLCTCGEQPNTKECKCKCGLYVECPVCGTSTIDSPSTDYTAVEMYWEQELNTQILKKRLMSNIIGGVGIVVFGCVILLIAWMCQA